MSTFTTSFKSLFIALIVFMLGSQSANAQTGCPYFNIETVDTTGISLALLSTNVDATISGVIANVVVEQTYYNAGDSLLDATYIFPMSDQAAIYAMEMQINNRIIKAVIKEKEEAQEIFDSASEAGQTASLLEQERPNVFQMSLANIQSSDTIRVRMTYTELMSPRDGKYQFVFPNIVGPRYTTEGEEWVGLGEAQLTEVSQTELNIDLQINAGMPVQAECKSHNVEFDNESLGTNTSLSTAPGADFIVDYKLTRADIHTGLLLYEGETENFFLSMVQPPNFGEAYDSPPREYIFLMDVSGSMQGEPLEISKKLITDLLSDLNYEDKFNIIFFAGGSSALAENSLNVSNQNINMAIDLLNNLSGGGGTNLIPALEQALDMEVDDDFSRTFVILTDGYVTVEKTAYNLIRDNLNEANFFSFGIGESVNRFIINGLAYVGEGEPFVATDFNDAIDVADDFKRYIEKPALTNITTSFSGVNIYDVEPLTIPDIFADRPVIIFGKYDSAENGSLTIEGEKAGSYFTHTFNFDNYTANAEENIALQYLWARKKIKLMSDYEIADNPNDTLSIDQEITALGLKYSLVTEFTSFVAVDSTYTLQQEIPEETDLTDDNSGGIVATEFDAVPKSTLDYLVVIDMIDESRILRLKVLDFDHIHADKVKFQIQDMAGQILKTQDFSLINYSEDEIIEILLGDLPSGMYVVSMKDGDKIIDTEKFVIMR